ncbi:hypothetical protein [Bacteroides ihuae]|uniref:hypothetical protein n=1 Tax=Bacteroides ihuae TaxID=1852362 RepID=UPI0011150130|nr:hypothetical protein [Bacteroides ihuae]
MRLQIDAERSILLVGFHPIHPMVALTFGKVGCFERIQSKRGFRESFNIQPFPENQVLWYLLTSLPSVEHHCTGCKGVKLYHSVSAYGKDLPS